MKQRKRILFLVVGVAPGRFGKAEATEDTLDRIDEIVHNAFSPQTSTCALCLR
jgi:hypothetical protein